MRHWPIRLINDELKYVATDQGMQLDTLLKDDGQVAVEQEGGDVEVLVVYDVPDDRIHRADLVVLQGDVDGVAVVWLICAVRLPLLVALHLLDRIE